MQGKWRVRGSQALGFVASFLCLRALQLHVQFVKGCFGLPTIQDTTTTVEMACLLMSDGSHPNFMFMGAWEFTYWYGGDLSSLKRLLALCGAAWIKLILGCGLLTVVTKLPQILNLSCFTNPRRQFFYIQFTKYDKKSGKPSLIPAIMFLFFWWLMAKLL